MNVFDSDNDLNRAIERLTIQDVWRHLNIPNVPKEGNVLVKSPLREDAKKSFSICFHGNGFKDHGNGDHGGVWKFAQIASGKDGKELADLVIEWSGITRTVRVKSVAKAIASGEIDPKKLPPEVKRLLKREEKNQERWKAEDALEKARRLALLPTAKVRDIQPWSSVVRGRYLEGWKHMQSDEKRCASIAADRGWPEMWAKWLHAEGLISMPWLPWANPGVAWAKRGKAFRVDMPTYDDKGRIDLRHVGYHQRFFVAGEMGPDGVKTPDRKSWVYVPYLPASEKIQNDFMRDMVAAELDRMPDAEGSRVPGLPFVMGSIAAPKFLCLAEGQWDAVTFAGAAGWLNDDLAWPPGAVVMGLRGVEGVEVFLAYWRTWLMLHRPNVLVLADNDAAGSRWTEVKSQRACEAPAPTFIEKLKAAHVREVRVSRVRKEHGKDFNDYWKARHPSTEDISAWLKGLGYLSASGSWN
ncbi:MAG: hypothetical protein WC378_00990 [Opitutaceae bacterium]|jgi:hypothetical protein